LLWKSLKTLLNIASNVKDKIDIEEVFDKIVISAKIDQALDQLEEGKYLTSEELDARSKNGNSNCLS